jgi:chromosome segregation ATPase
MDKEMEVYAENINRMEDEMANKFTRTEELQAGHETEKSRLKSIRTQVSSYRTGIAKQSTYHAMKHDTRRNMILQNEIYNRLNEVEKRLIGNESTIYGIQQYIEAKGAESNYQD